MILAGLRSFLRYLKQGRGFQVYDAEKVHRPKIPKHKVEYLTQEEVPHHKSEGSGARI